MCILLQLYNYNTRLMALSGTTRVIWYQKGKNYLDLLEPETVSGSGVSKCKSYHHMQICTSLQAGNPAITPPAIAQFFTGRMPFLPPNQQCQSTEGNFIISRFLCYYYTSNNTRLRLTKVLLSFILAYIYTK